MPTLHSTRHRRAPITSWRRTEHKDIPEIEHLMTKMNTKELFGNVDVAAILNKANLSLIQENKDGHMVSHVTLCSFPNVPAIPSNYWLEWVWKLYRVNSVTVRNTLFIHLLVWDPHYSNEFLGPLLHSIFTNSFYLQHLLLVIPPHARSADIFKEYFTCILPLEEDDFKRVQTLLLCLRDHHVPRLKLRRTKEEDNDDLVAILKKRAPEITDYYGEYYIAEMVAYPDYERKMITAEDKNTVMGVICLSKNIDYNLLNAAFELGPFQGLRRLHKKKGISFTRSSEQYGIMGEGEEQGEQGQKGEDQDDASQPDVSVLYDNKKKQQDMPSSAESEVSYDSESTEADQMSSAEETSQETSQQESISGSQSESGDSDTIMEGNAFKVELFALHEDWDDRYCFDFLLGAFTCYPDLDYCIVAFPSKLPKFPLLEHFVRAIPKSNQDFDQELYICHRNSILSEIVVREAVVEDLPSISSLTHSIYGHERIYEDSNSAITAEKDYQAYVVTSENDIVGLAVLCPEDDPAYFRTHYDVDTYIKSCTYGSNGIIKHLTMSPVFSNHTRFFLQDVCRLSDYMNLFYPLYPDQYDIKKSINYDVNTAVKYMVPLRPRRQIIYDINILEQNIPGPTLLQNKPPFALYYIGVHHCSLPKLFLGAKIVIVGASETALSFLETILYGPSSAYVGFNNVNIVGIQIPEKLFAFKALNMLFIKKTAYTPGYMPKISLRTWVNFVEGKMTGINRQEKYIVVNGRSTLTYDYLLLFCGVQYQEPQINPYLDTVKCIHGKRVYMSYKLPQNVFVINTQIDAVHAFRKLNKLQESDYNKIIVYGETVNAYCCIAAIREYGIPGEKIILVEPHGDPSENGVYITNNKVSEAVSLSLKNEGITVYSGYKYSNWKLNSATHAISSSTFKSYSKAITLPCSALFYYGELDVSLDVFNGIYHHFMKMALFMTVGLSLIQTSKPMTLISMLQALLLNMLAGFMQRHIGTVIIVLRKLLGEQMLKIWNPSAEKHGHEGPKRIPPVFKEPVVVSCILPRNFKYLSIKEPGRTNAFQDSIDEIEHGTTLETGECTSKTGYFRIHINLYNMIDEIICYTRNEINVSNLIQLYGLPEKLLQNLVLRFNMEAIPDFYTFFSEPWCYALYHDHFPDLRLKNNSLFDSKTLTGNIRLYFEEKGLSMLIDPELRDLAKRWFIEKQCEKDLESNLQEFLTKNDEHLPMYASPNIRKQLLRDLEDCMLFHERVPE